MRKRSADILPLLTGNKGMTLVEIAIVMVVIGLLIGIGAGMVGPLTKRIKINETKETVNAAVESLIGFAATNRRLPVPTGTEFSNNVRNRADAWTNPLYYIVDTSLTGTSDAICGRKSTTYTVCRDAACTAANNIQNVAFVIASSAENFNLQTGVLAGGACPAGQACVRVYGMDTAGIDDCTVATTAGDCTYYTGTLINRPEAYDDIVRWVTLNELRTKIGCQGAQLRIVNNELPPGSITSGSYNNVAVYADGGVPFNVANQDYRWCIQNTTGTAPTSLLFKNTSNIDNIVFSTNCSGLPETSWTRSTTVTISGTPTISGSFALTFFVRDDNDADAGNDNMVQKSFVITINP